MAHAGNHARISHGLLTPNGRLATTINEKYEQSQQNVMGFLEEKRIVSRLRNSTIEGISYKENFKKKPMLLWGTVKSDT